MDKRYSILREILHNTYGWVDEKNIADMKVEHEKVLETVKEYFDKLLEIM